MPAPAHTRKTSAKHSPAALYSKQKVIIARTATAHGVSGVYLVVLLPRARSAFVDDFAREQCVLAGIDLCVLGLLGEALETACVCDVGERVGRDVCGMRTKRY